MFNEKTKRVTQKAGSLNLELRDAIQVACRLDTKTCWDYVLQTAKCLEERLLTLKDMEGSTYFENMLIFMQAEHALNFKQKIQVYRIITDKYHSPYGPIIEYILFYDVDSIKMHQDIESGYLSLLASRY